MGGHLVIGPAGAVMRPGADQKFGLGCFEPSPELCESVHFSASSAMSEMARLSWSAAHIFSSTVLFATMT